MGGLNFHTSRKTYPNDTTDAQGTGPVPSCPQETCSPAPAPWEPAESTAKQSVVTSTASRPGRTQRHVKGSCAVGNVCKGKPVFQPPAHGSHERPPPPEASSSTGASERIIFKVLEEGRMSTVFGLEKACGFCFKPLSCCNVRRVYIRGPTPTPWRCRPGRGPGSGEEAPARGRSCAGGREQDGECMVQGGLSFHPREVAGGWAALPKPARSQVPLSSGFGASDKRGPRGHRG